ncbi:MAG: hypothetical protein FPO08_00280 [Geobacter sp.]|nr:MAG: hypothetical protein FPO08_00280 [Geobacter sp.]
METFWSIVIAVMFILFFCAFIPSGKGDCTVCGTHGLTKDLQFYNFKEIASAHQPLKGIGYYCTACAGKVEEAAKLVAVAKANAPTQTWPATYKGKVPVVPGSEQSRVHSDWQKEKESAREQLLVTSVYLFPEANAVKQIEFDKRTDSTGNYQYTVWRASGIPCKVQ